MNRNSIKLIVFFTIILMGTGIYIQPVSAYTQVTFNDNIWDTTSSLSGWNNRQSNPYYQRVVVNSGTGKYVIPVIVDSDSDQLHIRVVSSLGALLADIDTGITTQGGVAACDYDADEVIIAYGNSGDCSVKWFRFNTISYAVGTTYTSSMSGLGGGASCITSISNIIYSPTSTRWYLICGGTSYYGGGGASVMYFTGSAAGESAKTTSLTCSTYNIMYGAWESVTNHIYFLYYDGTAFHYIDFNCGTPAMTDIATCPTPGGAPTSDEKTAGYFNYFNFYKIEVLRYGTYLYLLGSWSISHRTGTWGGGSPTPGVRYEQTYLWYLKCNNTISTGSLLNNIAINDIKYDASGSTSLTLGLTCGYMFNNLASKTVDVNTFYQSITGGGYVSLATYHITDITTCPTSFDTTTVTVKMDDINWDYVSYDGACSYSAIYGWAATAVSKVNCYFSIGGTILDRIYTYNEVVIPPDSPLIANKDYTVTINVYMNGVADNLNDSYKLFVNGIERKSGFIVNGLVTFSFNANTAGTYTIYIEVYDSGSLVDTSDIWSHSVTLNENPTDTETTSALVVMATNLVLTYLPAVLTIFGTGSLAGGIVSKLAPQYVMVTWLGGCILGCILGGSLGILTQPVMIFGIFLFSILAVAVFKGSNNGGQ